MKGTEMPNAASSCRTLISLRYDDYSEKHVYVASTFEEGEDSYKYEKLEGDS
jgi:hypothetical protein